ncbi:rCG34632 [Rattus norvegicus]|uniref:RCG34632 n=1 Tax=Rattus norvegicus TaxID=10116 RepID=A6HHX1_RAT|nr:rCG34632 [Rattus norvegicus]
MGSQLKGTRPSFPSLPFYSVATSM